MASIIDCKAKHKLIDIENSEKNIFRVIEVSRLFDIFETNTIGLISPKKWQDPYESIFSNSYGVLKNFKTNDTLLNFKGDTKSVFGQCWTLNTESDATWKIYSPYKNKVKIKTKISKLYQIISKINDDWFRSCIGKVKYQSEKTIRKNISKTIKILGEKLGDIDLLTSFYLVKRKAFAYEREVRLLVDLPSAPENERHYLIDGDEGYEFCSIPVKDPHDFIDEIVFDPRMPDSLVRAYTSYLKNKFKYSKKIYKSKLYVAPNIRVPVVHPLWSKINL